MRVLDELELEIERIALAAGEVRPRRRWWRSTALLGLLPLGVATVAVAAATSGILSGAPVKNPPGLHLNPKSGLGVIVGSGKVLAVRTTDPAGGPPWALRLVKTSRGFGCVQVGRLVDGKLGVLGRDGAFDNDGKFHERGAEILQQTDCQQTDGAGQTFSAMSYFGLPDSGEFASCKGRARGDDPRPTCPPGSLRDVRFGLLGPEATAVTYEDESGAIVRQAVSRPEGGYLVVRRTDPSRRNFYFTLGTSPGSGLRTVEYRDGSVCRIVNSAGTGGARPCTLKGLVEHQLTPVPAEALSSPVRLQVGTRPEYPGPRRQHRKGTEQRRITVRFRARQTGDARSFYTVSSRMNGSRRDCRFISSGPITKDVVAGTVVTRPLYVPYRCRGTVTVSVGFTQQRTPGRGPFDLGSPENAKVGTATADF
jgi:hypothetical protein